MIAIRRLFREGVERRFMCNSRRSLILVCLGTTISGLSPPTVADDQANSDAAALTVIFGDRIIADNVAAIRARGAAMPPAERFEFLLKSVFPEAASGRIRMAGAFTQLDPAPVDGLPPERVRSTGGEIVAPLYDLLDVGQNLGRLAEVSAHVESLATPTDDFQQRAQASLRLLINLELGRHAAAEIAADNLLQLVLASTPTTIAELWPETLAVYRSIHHHSSDPVVTDLLTTILIRRSQVPPMSGFDLWLAHVSALDHICSGQSSEFGLYPLQVDDGDGVWQPAGRSLAHSRGLGYPQDVWMRTDRELHHVSGHHVDYLLYGTPLRGNFEVEADLHAPAVTQFAVAGRVLGMSAAGRGIIIGTFQEGSVVRPIERHWATSDRWVRFRAVVRDGTLTASLDGREIHTESLPEHHDPWIGIHSGVHSHARVRDIRITGDPEVPETVALSALDDLRGWVSYHGESINGAGGGWHWQADPQSNLGQIVAEPNESLSGTFAESLLRYQRPLTKEGSITYEFLHEPGHVEAHPAIDRLAFLIQPDGVSVHWITDGRYDTSGLGPDNVVEEPQCRRGPDQLPLRPGAWNRMKVSLIGRTVRLELNGVLVYERPLEPTNRRTLGLFRYLDRRVQVRKVVMRGDWPMSVPATADQDYANPAIATIDSRLSQLLERFDHEFSQDGLPEESFSIPAGSTPSPQLTSTGVLHAARSPPDGWAYSLIHPALQMHGDFDVRLRFDGLESPSDYSGCGLGLFLGDKHLELIRRRNDSSSENVLVTFVTPNAKGGARRHDDRLTTEAKAGTFRIVRRGDTVAALFADNDSTAFRIVAEHTWEGCRDFPARLDIRTTAFNRGRAQVVWKRFQVAAERLTGMTAGTERSP